MTSPPLTRYNNNLPGAPAPGTGANCHGYIMSMANLGVMAGIDPQQIHNDLRRAIPPGRRRLPSNEIPDAINKAMGDLKGGKFTPKKRPEPVVKDGKAALQRIIDQAKITTEVDLWEASPIRLRDDPQGDQVLLFETLYNRTDRLFIGERGQPGIIGDTIRTAGERVTFLQNGGKTGPHSVLPVSLREKT